MTTSNHTGGTRRRSHSGRWHASRDRPDAKYIVVTAITPTPLGEGKTTTTVGLGQALGKIGKRPIVAIRQASQGPVFGIKGGAAGGGYAQVVPMEDLNLHLTGDFHAVAAAHNECAAFLDNHIYQGNTLRIDPATDYVAARPRRERSLAPPDRATGLGGKANGPLRETGFDITAASEVMAILALATDRRDLRQRLGRIFLAQDVDGNPITAEMIGAAGMMAALLKDALLPNLLQTLENTPALVHAGPFGNIAHGNSSIVADQIGRKLGDYLVTEAGFGADLGAEKFFNIKCRASGMAPDAAVLVTTIRALKAHSGQFRIVAGRPLPPALLDREPRRAARRGCRTWSSRSRTSACTASRSSSRSTTSRRHRGRDRPGARGGAGGGRRPRRSSAGSSPRVGAAVSNSRRRSCASPREAQTFRFLYELDAPIKEKIATIATKIYGADGVTFEPAAERAIRDFTRLGFDKLPICMAKTHLSLSDNPALRGRPSGFTVTIRDVRASVGAGFLYPLAGQMMTMPGLGSAPGGLNVDIDDDGQISGLN